MKEFLSVMRYRYLKVSLLIIAVIIFSIALALSESAIAQGPKKGSDTSGKCFIDNKNGTMTHIETGLMWQKDDNGMPINYEEAKKYCNSLTLAGYRDWRLPTVFELKALYDGLIWKGEDHREPIFNWNIPPQYWSKTSGAELGIIGHAGGLPIKIGEDSIEAFSFDKDMGISANKKGKFLVRAVRGRVSKEYIKRWTDAFRDEKPEVRWHALANRIGRIEGPEAKEAIPAIKVLLSDPEEQIRERAKEIMEKIQTK